MFFAQRSKNTRRPPKVIRAQYGAPRGAEANGWLRGAGERRRRHSPLELEPKWHTRTHTSAHT
eukprot:683772-Alexandrium_andersonii.AAC.1